MLLTRQHNLRLILTQSTRDVQVLDRHSRQLRPLVHWPAGEDRGYKDRFRRLIASRRVCSSGDGHRPLGTMCNRSDLGVFSFAIGTKMGGARKTYRYRRCSKNRPLRQPLFRDSRHPFVNTPPHSSFRRRPESRGAGRGECSAVEDFARRGACPPLGRRGAWQNPRCQFAVPSHNSSFSYLGVPAPAGMSDRYENDVARLR